MGSKHFYTPSEHTAERVSVIDKLHTALQELDYFDCVEFHVVDSMHNLLLGTGKSSDPISIMNSNHLLMLFPFQ